MKHDFEETRPDPNFSVLIQSPNGPSTGDALAKALEDVYDIAVGSLDFGSGFLSNEEINNLRILGEACGFDPLHYNCNYRKEEDVPVKIRNRDEYVISHIEGIPCTCGAFDV